MTEATPMTSTTQSTDSVPSPAAGGLLVIPLHDEEQRMDRDWILAIARRGLVDVLLVDDGSTDGTLAACRAIADEDPRISVLGLPVNQGKANALLAGFRHAEREGYPVVGMADADMSVSIEDLMRGYELLQERADAQVVSGARVRLAGYGVIRPPLRQWTGRIVATAVTMVARMPMYDPQSPCKWFRVDRAFARAVARPCSSRWFGEAELLARLSDTHARSGGLVVVEYPLTSWHDAEGGHLSPRKFPSIVQDFIGLASASRQPGSRRRAPAPRPAGAPERRARP